MCGLYDTSPDMGVTVGGVPLTCLASLGEKMGDDLAVCWGTGGVSKVRGGQHTLVERLGYKVQGNASRLGTWTEGDKAELLALVAELQPCGATDWEVIADKLGRWSKACMPAPRRYRHDSIADLACGRGGNALQGR